MFHGPQHYVGPAQGYHEVFNADLLGAIVPTSAQLLAPRHLAAIGSSFVGGLGNIDENGTYLGLPLVAVAAYLVVRFRRRREFVFLAVLALVVYGFSLGPRLLVDGGAVRLPIGLPFRAISRIPGLDNILPVRLSLYVMLVVAVIVALGLDAYRSGPPSGSCARRTSSPPYRARAGRVALFFLVVLALVALVPRWPYRSHPLSPRYADFAADLTAIPTGSIVLAYPYPTPFSDDAMLWQALSGMRFRILGGYALIPGVRQAPAAGPAMLQPIAVEGMLVNSYAVSPVPGFPALVATPYSVEAKSVRVVRSPRSSSAAPAVRGEVSFLDVKLHRFIVDLGRTGRVEVDVSSSTRYFESGRRISGMADLRLGQEVSVDGNRTVGTLNASMVDGLRTFVQRNRVAAIVVELGKRDSASIVRWVTEAFGPPTRIVTGGVVWIRASGALTLTQRISLASPAPKDTPQAPDTRPGSLSTAARTKS